MLIGIFHAAPTRQWHTSLVARLAAQGHEVQLIAAVHTPGALALDAWRNLGWLFAAERRIYRARHLWFAPAPDDETNVRRRDDRADVDLAIVLDGDAPGNRPSLHPRFDGAIGESALRAALLAGRSPLISICERRPDGSEVALAAGLPAIEDRFVLTRSIDHVLPRLVTLIAQAVTRTGTTQVDLPVLDPMPAAGRASAVGLLAKGVGHRLRRRLRRAFKGNPDWRIAYRVTAHEPDNEPDNVITTVAWPAKKYRPILDPADGFYADPFAFEHEGRHHVFFEDFSAVAQKGVVARLEIDATGMASAAKRVLERPVHLSYPLVLSHADAIYMLPEMGAAHCLQLFRADPFPDNWVADRVLLEGTVVADATPILHDGVWWIFGSLNDDAGSSWDQLALYHAPDLLGPWTAHSGNPVVIDAGAARPAGAMWHDGGVLMRVAQDCRIGYGRGIAICRVDRLDREGFAQTVVARLGPPPGSGAFGTHTLNRNGNLEVIDLNCMPN